MEYWLTVLFLVLQDFAILLFFDAFFRRRFSGKKFWGLWLVSIVVGFIVNTAIQIPISSFKIIFNMAMFLVINIALYHGTFPMRLLATAMAYTLLYLIDFISQLVPLMLFHIDYETFVYDRPLYTTVSICTDFILILLAAALKYYHKPQHVQRSPWAVLTLPFPGASILLLLPLYRLFNSEESFPLLISSTAVLAMANIGVIILVDWLEQNALDRELAFAMKSQLQAQTQSIEALNAAYANQRKAAHDFQHHLSALSGLMQQDASQAANYLRELNADQLEYAFLVNTCHPALDAVLNQKTLCARRLGIDIQLEVNDLSPLHIPSTDCTVVLANLLDNALEACVKLPSEKRRMEVKALYTSSPAGAALFLSVINTSPPVEIVDGHIATTKANTSAHGFGLSNVQQTLARYGAEYVMFYQDGAFQFSLEWPDIAL